MRPQDRLDKLAEELFGTSKPYVMLILDKNPLCDMPEIVRHDGYGNWLDIATWDGFKWVVVVSENLSGQKGDCQCM